MGRGLIRQTNLTHTREASKQYLIFMIRVDLRWAKKISPPSIGGSCVGDDGGGKSKTHIRPRLMVLQPVCEFFFEKLDNLFS